MVGIPLQPPPVEAAPLTPEPPTADLVPHFRAARAASTAGILETAKASKTDAQTATWPSDITCTVQTLKTETATHYVAPP